MEAAFVNVVEPGDRVLIGINGVFGERMADVAERCGADVRKVSVPWGKPLNAEAIRTALDEFHPRVLAVVHAETSTGVLQPIEDLSRILKGYPETLFLVDTVTSLGGHPVNVDAWGIDICYSGTQKCLSCPPGLAPVSLSPRALEKAQKRKTKVPSWYLDVNLLATYWGQERVYHHTAPISMNYALREALRIVEEEGLERRWKRHSTNAREMWEGLEALGLKLIVPPAYRLPSLTTVSVPDGVDEAAIRRRLLDEYDVEIAGGLGAFKGKAWRIGLMGYSSRRANILVLLGALERLLGRR
jgi:alanine-glyoxylate transaminase/serine-glyoxylate transaminase/serine-pyruvate transaminase